MNVSKDKWSSYLMLVIPPLTWAGNFVVGRFIYTEIPAGILNLGRWMLALVVLLPFVLLKREFQARLITTHWKYLSVLGLAGVTLFHTLMYSALRDIPAMNAGIVVTATPILIPLFTRVMGDTQITLTGVLGILLAASGAVTVLSRCNLEDLLAFQFGTGEWLVLLATPCWAIYTVMVKYKPSEMSWGGAEKNPANGQNPEEIPFAIFDLLNGYRILGSPAVVLSILYIGLFPSVLAYICWNIGVSRIGAHHAGLFMYLMPVMSAILAISFLGEDLAMYHVVGVVLVISGIFLAQYIPVKIRS